MVHSTHKESETVRLVKIQEMKNTEISIIIPAYNAEKTIERTIKSIQLQTFQNWELIVVNDGSSDDTLNILNQIASTDERIIVVNQINCGAYRARLTGVENSSSSWVTFVDSDDILEPSNLQTLSDIVSDTDKCDIIVGNIKFDGNTLRKGQSFKHKVSGVLTPIQYQTVMLEGKTTIGPYAKLYKHSLFMQARESLIIERFDQNEDLLMLLKLTKHCKNGIYIDPRQRVTYTYFRRYGSMSAKKVDSSKWFHLFDEIRKSLIDDSSIDALTTYSLNTLYDNCILQGVKISDSHKEISKLLGRVHQSKLHSKQEKLIVTLLQYPLLCTMYSCLFRLARKISRIIRK